MQNKYKIINEYAMMLNVYHIEYTNNYQYK